MTQSDVAEHNNATGRAVDEPFERLKRARIAAGYSSAAKAARAMRVKLETYHKHENGMNGLGRNAVKYASFFNVSLDWLLRGEGTPELSGNAPTPDAGWIDLAKLREALAVLIHITAGLSEDEADRLGQELIEVVRMPPDFRNGMPASQQNALRVETLSRLAVARTKNPKPRNRKH